MPKKCPKCGKPIEVVAYGSYYVIEGCPDHREYDRVRKLDVDVNEVA